MNLGPAFWVLAALGVVAASAYGLYFLGRPASWLRAGVKTLAIGAPAAGFVIAGTRTLQAETPEPLEKRKL